MAQDGAFRFPPRPDDAGTWDDYVAALRTLRTWAGARDDAELAGAVPGLTAEQVGEVLGERRHAIPDRRVVELIVRACLLLRDRSKREIAAEQVVWRTAWDAVLATARPGRRTRAAGPQRRAPGIAAGVLLPAVTGVVVNLATSNTRNPWAWGAVVLVLVSHASLLAAGPERWAREPVLALAASLAAVAVTVGLVLALVPMAPASSAVPGPTATSGPATSAGAPGTGRPCAPADVLHYFGRPVVHDPGLDTQWTHGYACPNPRAPVHAAPDAASPLVGTLRPALRSILLCTVKVGDDHWYRTAADDDKVGKGWGYVSQEHVRAAHPVNGLATCPR